MRNKILPILILVFCFWAGLMGGEILGKRECEKKLQQLETVKSADGKWEYVCYWVRPNHKVIVIPDPGPVKLKEPEDNNTTDLQNPITGSIFKFDSQEYIYDGENWVRLNSTGAAKTTGKNSPAITGNVNTVVIKP